MFQNNSSLPNFLQVSISILILFFLAFAIYYLIYIGNRHVSQDKRINIRWQRIFQIIGVAIGASIVLAIFRRYPILGSTLFAMFVSVLLAYLLNPLVNKLEAKKVPRSIATIIVYAALVFILVGLGFLVIPSLTEQIKNFILNLPATTNSFLEWTREFMQKNNIDDNQVYTEVSNFLSNFIQESSTKLLTWSSGIFVSIVTSIRSLVTVVLVPIITYFFLVDKDRLMSLVKRIIPRKHYKKSRELYLEIDETMSAFVRGRLLMAVFVGIATMILLLILGIDFAFVIGMLAMIGDVIPYIGPLIGFIPALVFALIQSPIKAIWVGIFYLLIQWVENNILGPKLLGSSTGMHPLVILLSILIGGGMFGVWGMILSVPFVALVMVLFNFLLRENTEKKEVK